MLPRGKSQIEMLEAEKLQRQNIKMKAETDQTGFQGRSVTVAAVYGSMEVAGGS